MNPSGRDKKSRVIVADDHPIVRHALAQLINHESDLTCSAEVGGIAELRAAIAREHPDLILFDLNLGQEDGLESIKSLKAQYSNLRILVVSGGDENLFAERAIRAGAAGYVMKEAQRGEVVKAIRAVLQGELHVSQKVALRAFQKSLEAQTRPNSPGLDTLTDRELQVFQLLGAELRTREIAAKLHLSVKTIETYRENIKHKLGLRDAEALRRCAKSWVQDRRLPVS